MITRRSLGVLAALPLLGARPAFAQAYPARELLGIIQWGAGGATDVTARAVTPHVEQALGQKIVLQNRTGGSGAIGLTAVHNAPADGYTLLYAAENPLLYRVLNISRLDFTDFHPVNVLARGVPVLVTHKDRPWNTLADLLEHIRKNPGRVKMGGTGAGGQPHVIQSMLGTVTEFRVISVPFDGEGPALTALQGGHVDFVPSGLGAAAEHIRAGRLKPLAVVNPEPVPTLPDVAPVTKDLPEMGRYLPWGSFYGVWVRRDVPAEARDKLVAAFHAGASNRQFTDLMTGNGNIVMNISGDEAERFLKRWQSVTAWVLQEAGAAKTSPAELGIPRP